MPRQVVQLVNDEIYHLVLRSVGDTKIFINDNDYYRGVFSIYEFNNSLPTEIWKRRRNRIVEKKKEKKGGAPTSPELVDKREKFVEIMAFSLMPNHLHLMVRQIKNNGITKFMQKVGGGYAYYFNKKYKRKGHLFNQFRAIHIKTDKQIRNVFSYIHCNRTSLIESGWKEKGIGNKKKVVNFLENDKWHSLPDYLGKKNFPSVTNRNFLTDLLGGVIGCKKTIKNWIDYKGKTDFKDTELE